MRRPSLKLCIPCTLFFAFSNQAYSNKAVPNAEKGRCNVPLAELSHVTSTRAERSVDEAAKQFSEQSIMGPLTPEMTAILENHPIWAKYGKANDGGANLEFTFDTPPLSPGEVMEGKMGESIQSHFVATTLRTIFPKSHLYADASPSRPPKRKIQIIVRDSKEGGLDITSWKSLQSVTSFLEMSVLKSANGLSVPESKETVRSAFGIQPDQFVISLYNFYYLEKPGTELAGFLRASGKVSDKCVIFCSNRNAPNNKNTDRALSIYRELYPGVHVHAQSRLLQGDLSGPGPHFVVNDTKGRMPAINRASDIVLMQGPHNLFEGLNEGTPTIFVRHDGVSPRYDKATYDAMATLALESKGALSVPDEEHIAPLLAKLNTNLPKVVTPPYLLPQNGRSAFNLYLDELEKLLDHESQP